MVNRTYQTNHRRERSALSCRTGQGWVERYMVRRAVGAAILRYLCDMLSSTSSLFTKHVDKETYEYRNNCHLTKD